MENLFSFLSEDLSKYLVLVSQVLLYLVAFATLVAKFTKSKKDDEMLGKAEKLIFKVISYLPTIGVNPRTKAIEDANKELKEALKKVKSGDASVN